MKGKSIRLYTLTTEIILYLIRNSALILLKLRNRKYSV